MVWCKRVFPIVLTAATLLLLACSPVSAESPPRTKILVITSDLDHPYGSHMYEFDSQLLASCLSQHRGVEVTVRKGFPEDAKELEGIDAIVFFSKPAGEVVLDPKNHEKFSRLMKTGAGFVARTGVYVLDVEVGALGLLGLQVTHEKHLYGELVCGCGHVTRSVPGRGAPEAEWKVELTEWHLVGPMLAALIVCLSHRMLVSRVRIQEFLHDWLGIYLSTSTLNQCIHEAGRAVAPVEEQLIDELKQAYQAHADETPWKEWGQWRWLWVCGSPAGVSTRCEPMTTRWIAGYSTSRCCTCSPSTVPCCWTRWR